MIDATIEALVEATIREELITEQDRIYSRNRVLARLNKLDFDKPTFVPRDSIPNLLETLTEYAVEAGLVENLLEEKDRFMAEVMDVFVSKPSEVTRTFNALRAVDVEAATSFFYKMSQASNYIQTQRIANNITYKAPTRYGTLDITINLSKPEKDPREIARARLQPAPETNYPTGLLAIENEGYGGHLKHPARANHRIIPLTLGGEEWSFQYSPYLYYNEHSILLSNEVRDMVIDRSAFERLLDFVGQFPHYFAGSNADLPIVGGSILTHDHYQAGRYRFAMDDADVVATYRSDRYDQVDIETLEWPLSVVRLRSTQREQLAMLANQLLGHWQNYEDGDIVPYTGDVRHNTVTPIARRRDGRYELDLVLRNNRTSEAHPDGIFHPHADVHHIKRENIGLIEVMGLAVLPARLKTELEQVVRFIEGEDVEVADMHKAWAEELKTKSGDARMIVDQAVVDKFVKGLEDAGVFKQTVEGQERFTAFMSSFLSHVDKVEYGASTTGSNR
ncbi:MULTISPECIES: UDP-glucose--hexose-1-phosphate uridylyltransferase [unclassified Exiguobacterium]|uniref:UDP-glucose--hexose-1-phosphate uridylyltransferase n=1 Tax=unclassified Exiguobacterium TaxID=2644629 RepID=UPI00103B38C0|nr:MULTISPECIES: UDP-glucose--hexose-1-phosphate uridylyltransferase [unclassified Exiguobacterium]TCI48255.1 UDP-glucose--hexose-1-phosphate uridylyltransferase [Exiguobacterium sp. SH5S32]TCI55141.1 UDP-glucose--hexose-1-phosphate uridylyltransferase [Exiguobacterium sp. SH1S4]TCI74935.1 UDP-glucose--hexose-1-phosphate uridylyltransferase [Exiguobacterium sp. SH1S1]